MFSRVFSPPLVHPSPPWYTCPPGTPTIPLPLVYSSPGTPASHLLYTFPPSPVLILVIAHEADSMHPTGMLSCCYCLDATKRNTVTHFWTTASIHLHVTHVIDDLAMLSVNIF